MAIKTDSGKFPDIPVKHKHDTGSQATYTLFPANKDGIHIATASITWSNGGKYAWVGDWGRQCGGTWYLSNQTDRINYLCNAGPPFRLRRNPDTDHRHITYWVPQTPRSSGLNERDVTATSRGLLRQAVFAKYRRNSPLTNGTTVRDMIGMSLAMADSDVHTATDLCGGETSYAPDLVNVKRGRFCRMSDKALWPIYNSANVTNNYFNVDSHQLIINGIAARGEPYKKIID